MPAWWGTFARSLHHPREGSKGVDGARLASNRENSHPGGSANRILGCAHRTPTLPVPRAPTDVFIYYICDWVGKYSRLDRESVCHFENERRASLRVTAAAAAAFVAVAVACRRRCARFRGRARAVTGRDSILPSSPRRSWCVPPRHSSTRCSVARRGRRRRCPRWSTTDSAASSRVSSAQWCSSFAGPREASSREGLAVGRDS